MAAQPRAAGKAAPEAHTRREQRRGQLQSAHGAPHKHGPGRPPQDTARLERLAQEAEVARQAPQRIRAQREQSAPSIRTMGQAYHCVDLERGGRRHGPRMAADIHKQMDTVRTVAQHAGLRQTCRERIEKAERGLPTMPATIAWVSGYVRQQVAQLQVTSPVADALHAPLIPACSLDRVAQTRTGQAGEPRRELAERRRTPL
jgi:hypothetical protein